MQDKSPRVLIVDDEPVNVEILLEYLDDAGYELDTAANGREAWEKLEAQPDLYDVVLLDRMMVPMNGMEVLQRIKAHPVLHSMPVILQTALAGKDDLLAGIQAGAYYYLTKPFEEELLRSVVSTAVGDRQRYRRVQSESDSIGRSFELMFEGRFRYRTLEAARDLAGLLANACPQPKKVVIGMSELLINAVEHGNLGITYDEKTRLREQNLWDAEIAKRLRDPGYAGRQVEVVFRRSREEIEVTITDQGDGFDWGRYLEVAPSRAFDTHGRGIAMARMISFDSVEYRGNGNQVVVSVGLAGDDSSDS